MAISGADAIITQRDIQRLHARLTRAGRYTARRAHLLLRTPESEQDEAWLETSLDALEQEARFRPYRHRPRLMHVYLMRADNGLWKIGRAHDVVKRHASLNTQSPVAIHRHSQVDTEWAEFEFVLHASWARFRVRGEWFAFPDRLIPAVQRSMMMATQLHRRRLPRWIRRWA